MTEDAEDWEQLPRRERLKRLWAARDNFRFWGLVSAELIPAMLIDYRHDFSSLSYEDIEDCFPEAFERLINGEAGNVVDPEAYIRRAVRNACIDEKRRRRRWSGVRVDLEIEFTRATGLRPCRSRSTLSRDGEVRIDCQRAAILVEEAVDGVEANGGWVESVVKEAIARLSPALRRLATYVMEHKPEVQDTHAAEDLGMKPKSYRANKSKAFAALKRIIPVVIVEFGIEPSEGAQEAIFGGRHAIPTDDEP
jgi:DNA-directed RNA polymerase specialized sigma24 family protein